MKHCALYISLIWSLLLCCGCLSSNTHSADSLVCNTEVGYSPAHARGFEILADGHGNTIIRVTQPWQGTTPDEQRLVIFGDEASAEGYEGQYIVGPAERVVCMSTSYVAMLDALGEVDAVVGVSGKDYVMNSAVANNEAVRDVGYDTNLDYETLLMLDPDIVLMYGVTGENSAVTAKLREIGIPYLYLGDYVEESPLGKAEWLVCMAEIVGCRECGEARFSDIVERYNAIRSSLPEDAVRPKVMVNLPYQDVWYMPSDSSYMVQLIEDAGGDYIYKGRNSSTASVGISLEEAYHLVSDADIWLNVGQCTTMGSLEAAAPHFMECEVVKQGRVYNNNRRRSPAGGSDFWESAIVNPDVVLQDLVTIMKGGTEELYYHHCLSADVEPYVADTSHGGVLTTEGGSSVTGGSSSSAWGYILFAMLALAVLYAVVSIIRGMAWRYSILILALVVLLIALVVVDLLVGSSSIPFTEVWAALSGGDTSDAVIVNKLRLPKIIVAIASGMALAASGLQMQTLFRNPLAGPYVLGINAGASLGVALFTLALPMMGAAAGSWLADMGVTAMAWIGSAAILLLMMVVSRKIKNINVILIMGMMLGSAISAVVGILQYLGTDESLKTFVVWTMGSLSTVTVDDLTILVPTVVVGLVLAVVASKALNMLLLGEGYARTMGLNVKLSRTVIFLSTTLLAGTVTAYCGPIGFIGLAMPHLARMTFRTANHNILMPATMLWGAVSMLLCCVVCDVVAHSGIMLPVNIITSLLGVPIIIIVIFRNRNRQ